MLYERAEVHVRIAFEQHSDFYGVDMPTKEELLAYNKSNAEMCKHIN